MSGVADDDVIADCDLQGATAICEPPRHANIGIRWTWIAAGVIVHEHDTPRCTDDCRAKYFSRVGHRFIERADRNKVMTTNPLAHVEQEHCETFAIRVEVRGSRDVLAPVLHGILRFDAAGKFVRGGFPQ